MKTGQSENQRKNLKPLAEPPIAAPRQMTADRAVYVTPEIVVNV